MLQFSFKIAHLAGSVNTAADFFSRVERKVREEIFLGIREDVLTKPIKVTTSSSVVAIEVQLSFIQTDGEDETDEQTPEQREHSRKKTIE